MRLSIGGSSSLALALLAASSSVNAGFLDRLTGGSNAGQPKASSGSQIHLAADPAPPSEPSLDAFGGSAPHHAHVEPVQAGAPSVALGQPAVKTASPVNDGSATAAPIRHEELPYEGTEYRWKMFRVSSRTSTFVIAYPLTDHLAPLSTRAFFQFRPAEMVTEAWLL